MMGESGVGSRKVTIQSGNTTFKKTLKRINFLKNANQNYLIW